MPNSFVRLCDLKPGECACVKACRGEGRVFQRLCEMGVIEGAKLRMVRFAPFGDPLHIVLEDYHLSLRQAEAALIEVERLADVVEPAVEPAASSQERRQSDRDRSTPVVAFVGNPNSGKTTLFNRLTGLAQKVGNYPGVTVERKIGRAHLGGQIAHLVDLPGTYSLAAHSPDEMVAVDVLLGHLDGESRPDLVVHVADASNLERNLYLHSQVRELGLPVVLALTMTDVAERRGIRVRTEQLSARLGVPVVCVLAHTGVGVDALRSTLAGELERIRDDRARGVSSGERNRLHLDDELHQQVERLSAEFGDDFRRACGRELHPFEVLRALIDRDGHAEGRLRRILGPQFETKLDEARANLNGVEPLAALETRVRYAWVRERTAGCLERQARPGPSPSERLDRILTHRVFGLLIFAAIMLVVFQAIFAWAAPLMDLVDGLFVGLGDLVGGVLPDGALESLVVNGVIQGVGMVIVFLPQILILFLFIGLLEDCGYMARAAFVMDKLMSKCGLSGKSFIPMLSGFACAIPGVMAARVIEDRRDRLATILVTPLMSCSARLPVYSIFIGSFIPDTSLLGGVLGLRAVTFFGLYLLGIVVAIAVAWTLRKTLLRGPKPPFVLELPSYKWPVLGTVLLRLWGKAQAFLVRAGTIIFAVSVVVWALSYFPHSTDIAERYDVLRAEAQQTLEGDELAQHLEELDLREQGDFGRDSYFGRIGRVVEPVFAPLGWDWRISMAAMASFPAREVVVAALGIVFDLGGDVDEESASLRANLQEAKRDVDDDGQGDEKLITIPVALSILVFFALCCQCGATLATIKRETNSWLWPLFTFVYMTALAYVGAFAAYQVGSIFLG